MGSPNAQQAHALRTPDECRKRTRSRARGLRFPAEAAEVGVGDAFPLGVSFDELEGREAFPEVACDVLAPAAEFAAFASSGFVGADSPA